MQFSNLLSEKLQFLYMYIIQTISDLRCAGEVTVSSCQWTSVSFDVLKSVTMS